MKIIIERKYKKDGYTIGRMLIDGKFICNTLEPNDRNLYNNSKAGITGSNEWKESDVQAKFVKSRYEPGTTAIPTGTYKVAMYISSKFHAQRAYLRDVPGFTGIMIHEGNTRKDTHGCILVGYNTIVGGLTESRKALAIVNKAIQEAEARRELVVAQIKTLPPYPLPL